MDSTTRELNLQRISEIHKALRWAAIGGPIPDKWKNCSLGGLCLELKARMELEYEYAVTDPTPMFLVSAKLPEKECVCGRSVSSCVGEAQGCPSRQDPSLN